MDPTEAGFLAFIRNIMAIPAPVLPSDSLYIGWSYNVALSFVNETLRVAGAASPTFPSIYALAVYNLGGDRLVNYAQDVPDAPNVVGSDPPLPFFANMRRVLNINAFVSGVIQSASDESTSESMVVPDFMKGLTFRDLQMTKTPWGREYLGIAQDYGPSVWGIT